MSKIDTSSILVTVNLIYDTEAAGAMPVPKVASYCSTMLKTNCISALYRDIENQWAPVLAFNEHIKLNEHVTSIQVSVKDNDGTLKRRWKVYLECPFKNFWVEYAPDLYPENIGVPEVRVGISSSAVFEWVNKSAETDSFMHRISRAWKIRAMT